ncbi:MAG: hypothetical protein KA746_08665 [Pyrinomonadaceae bacterium]|nr:hypothetical protein [Pyrinomonadaceae bacterium]MBP6213742.1 hypothetical protein [Pyrinomonadaceae bacterium]
MDEIKNETPDTPAEKKQTWSQFLETEQAVRVIYLIFGFIAILMVLTFLQSRTDAICCGDWDGYYHIKWSSLLWENFKQGKWLPTFEWLPLTVLNPADYADHHFLFHLLQIPFLWFFELVMAAKVATVFYSTLAIFSVYWLIFRYGIKHQLIWLAAIMTCANAFYYRMNMGKAPALTIIISVLGIHLLFQRRYVWLGPLMFAFVWTYSLFPLLWFAAIIWTAIIVWNERRFEWRPLAYTTAGMVLGNVINPYFPQNLGLFFEHFWTKFKVGSDFAVAVGGEWYPYTGMELIMNFPIALLAMLIGYILFVPKGSKLPEKAAFFLAFTSILLAAQFRSKRFAEYFPPFAILFAAFAWQSFTAPKVVELPDDFQRDIDPYLDANKPTEKQAWITAGRSAAPWVIGAALLIFWFYNLVGLHRFGFDEAGMIDNITSNEPDEKYRRSMEWATGLDETGADNIPKGELIFNCTWDDFPKLFFLNTKHRYVYGLDPNYLYSANPELYKLLKDLTEGKIEDPAPVIREKFGARYIFADAKENTDMIAKALDSGWAEIIYEDDEARLLKIRDVKGEPYDPAKDLEPETDEEKKILDEEEKKAGINLNAPLPEDTDEN